MPVSLQDQLVVAISSRALFDFEEENRLFENTDPASYLRLQRARRGIEQSARLHVGGLAWRCGFANPSDFSKLFRARFGLSPTEWHQRLWGR